MYLDMFMEETVGEIPIYFGFGIAFIAFHSYSLCCDNINYQRG